MFVELILNLTGVSATLATRPMVDLMPALIASHSEYRTIKKFKRIVHKDAEATNATSLRWKRSPSSKSLTATEGLG